jgi:hypothetical protein
MKAKKISWTYGKWRYNYNLVEVGGPGDTLRSTSPALQPNKNRGLQIQMKFHDQPDLPE